MPQAGTQEARNHLVSLAQVRRSRREHPDGGWGEEPTDGKARSQERNTPAGVVCGGVPLAPRGPQLNSRAFRLIYRAEPGNFDLLALFSNNFFFRLSMCIHFSVSEMYSVHRQPILFRHSRHNSATGSIEILTIPKTCIVYNNPIKTYQFRLRLEVVSISAVAKCILYTEKQQRNSHDS